MPRYVYSCDSCKGHFQIRHGMRETQEICSLCEETGTLVRIPQIPAIKNQATTENKTVGTLTKDYIENNRELLSEMKKEARGQDYDD